ncbi:Glycosyltransferase AglE [uncultured archaeon]|nr:Glycosyltransferase AglE [uncultured archaeon]
MPPKVSVIIPALNEEKNIEATLKSVRHQDYGGEIELIVADGHSSDRTVSISKKYCNQVVEETTHTIAAGRQAGARVSHGELLLYTDADTLVDQQWVRRMVAAFEDKRVGAVYGFAQPRDTGWLEFYLIGGSALIAAFLLNFIGLDYVSGNNLAIRKTVFDKIGGFNIYLRTGEDTDIVQRARKVSQARFAADAVVHYSMRRIREWGYPKYLWFHTKNFFMTTFFHKPAKKYEAVRK